MSDDTHVSVQERELKAAVALYWSNREGEAAAEFERLADLGSPAAMTWAGYIYLEGEGVAPDEAKAFTWFQRAATAGDSTAMRWIGHLYRVGRAVEADPATARHWYWKGAEAGDVTSMVHFGIRLLDGDGGDKDAAAGKGWLLRAAEAGDANGQHNLAGALFSDGKAAEAELWLGKAAAQGYQPSVESLRQRRAHRLFEKKLYVEAFPLFVHAADSGSTWDAEYLGNLYWYGHGIAKDRDRAAHYFEIAYAGGRHVLAGVIGRIHHRAGRGRQALDWFRKETGEPISSLYWQYRVLKKFPELESYRGERDILLRQAADAGHAFAMRDVAVGALKGHGAFGTRWHGLKAFVKLWPYVCRLARANTDDERLT